MFAIGVWGGGLAIASFAKSPPFFPQVIGLPLLWVGMIAFFVMLAVFVARRNFEEGAGFTTINGYARNLEQRDPYTGAVIREAGAPLLDSSTFKIIVDMSKESERTRRSRSSEQT